MDFAEGESASGMRVLLADVLVKIMRCLANLALTPRLRAQVARHADINCIIDVLSGEFLFCSCAHVIVRPLTQLQHPIANGAQLKKSWC